MHGALPERLAESKPAAPLPVKIGRVASTLALFAGTAFAGFGAYSI
jgi:hypothetical protein